MPIPVVHLLGVLALLGPVRPAGVTPLFASDEVLTLTIEAPLGAVFSHRDRNAESYSARILAAPEDDGGDVVEASIRTRGRSRLAKRVCPFPPLRLKFRKKTLPGTVFEGQDRLKLVTHCRDDDDGEQRLLLESVAYRIYNLLSDFSFRIRMAHITYRDTSGERGTVTRYGFLIEDVSDVAERNGWQPLSVPVVPPDAVDPDNLVRLEFFQYLIGNTDWSAFMSDDATAGCCHNTKPVGGPAGPVFVVPYDFDITGLVNPPYAARLYRGTLDELGIRSVRDRRFRGGCRSEELWPEVAARFNERRGAIEALVREQEGLSPGTRDEALAYLGGFYEVINDPSRVRRELGGHCRRY